MIKSRPASNEKQEQKEEKIDICNSRVIIDIMNVHGLNEGGGGGGWGGGNRTVKSGNTQVITKKEQKQKSK